jgi:hypothetical protein
MIKKELAKDPALSEEDWSRFLPDFKKKNTSKRKKPQTVRDKKTYTPFPPAQLASKKDQQIESGEYVFCYTIVPPSFHLSLIVCDVSLDLLLPACIL